MSPTEYKPHHPVAWAIIAGGALFSLVAVAAIMGWLPTSDETPAATACTECGVVESIRTVAVPVAVDEPAAPAAETAAGAGVDTPSAQVSYSYETTVRRDDGSTSVFSQAEPPTWQTGDKVRIVDGMILLSG